MKNVLFFGDSNFWCGRIGTTNLAPGPAERLAWEERVAGIAQALLGSDWRVIEDALPGRTATIDDPLSPNHMGLRHLEIALELHAPVDVLVLMIGTNEIREMFGMSAAMIACSAERLVALAKRPASGYPARRIIAVAPPPMHPRVFEMQFGFMFGRDAYEKSLGLSAAYRDMSNRQGVEFFDCAPLNFELNEIDGVHFSPEDIRRFAGAICQKIRSDE